jgi:hypothetical protein
MPLVLPIYKRQPPAFVFIENLQMLAPPSFAGFSHGIRESCWCPECLGLDILRGVWMVLPAAPAPSEVVATVRESKGGQEEEEELAWLEALAGCLGAAAALARGQHDTGSQVREKFRYGGVVPSLTYVLRARKG